MKWIVKSAMQKAISFLPFHNRVNYFLQTRVSHSLPVADRMLEVKKQTAQKHLENFATFGKTTTGSSVFYEFGAGYDLATALYFYKNNAMRHVVTDIAELIKLPLVNNIVARLEIKNNSIKNIAELKTHFNIEYLCPLNPANTGLSEGSVDYISSTDTLEHIPASDILPVLLECRRILKPGGIISSLIDLQDHYAYFDKSLSPFNFYKYGDTAWSIFFNNKLQYQNRLLADEYVELFHQAGFTIVKEERIKALPDEESALTGMKKAAKFAQYETHKINCKRLWLVAKKD